MIKFKKKPPTLEQVSQQWPIRATVDGTDVILHFSGVVEVLDDNNDTVDFLQVKRGTPEQMIKRYKKL